MHGTTCFSSAAQPARHSVLEQQRSRNVDVEERKLQDDPALDTAIDGRKGHPDVRTQRASHQHRRLADALDPPDLSVVGAHDRHAQFDWRRRWLLLWLGGGLGCKLVIAGQNLSRTVLPQDALDGLPRLCVGDEHK
jgi:hypothetical protein